MPTNPEFQNLQLSDSHCHIHMLDLNEFQDDVDNVIQAATDNGIAYMLCVGTRLEDHSKIITFCERYKQVCGSVGLHPNETATAEEEPDIDRLLTLAAHPKILAIGETGLDYYRTEEKQPWQHERFRVHIRAAIQSQKPLIIHTRNARQDTLKILREEQAEKIGGVFHCFTEDWATAEAALSLNFYISFSGIVTFKNAVDLQEVAKRVPLDKMLIETDAPYLAPVPHRGKMNQPAYVRYVAEFLAQLKGVSLAELANATTENYKRLFKPTR